MQSLAVSASAPLSLTALILLLLFLFLLLSFLILLLLFLLLSDLVFFLIFILVFAASRARTWWRWRAWTTSGGWTGRTRWWVAKIVIDLLFSFFVVATSISTVAARTTVSAHFFLHARWLHSQSIPVYFAVVHFLDRIFSVKVVLEFLNKMRVTMKE